MFITGHARGLLSAERVALNFMQRLSGIATLTRAIRRSGEGNEGANSRHAEDNAGLETPREIRRARGRRNESPHGSVVSRPDQGQSSRRARWRRCSSRSSARARSRARNAPVEVECDSLEQVRAAVDAGADVIMLDNMSNAELREAVELDGWPRGDRSVRWREPRDGSRNRGDRSGLDFSWCADSLREGDGPRAGLRMSRAIRRSCDVCGSTQTCCEIKCKVDLPATAGRSSRVCARSKALAVNAALESRIESRRNSRPLL